MKLSKAILSFILPPLMACASASTTTTTTNSNTPARGILRVTNYTREAMQVYKTVAGKDTYLRLIQPGNSESFQVEGTTPGQVIYLKATTPSGREYTSRDGITLGAGSCTRNYGAPPAKPGCEWTVP